MTITITNGTLTSINETLTADSGYDLPSSITVSGATSSYNNGTISLTSLTSSMSITAVGTVSFVPYMSFGSLSIDKMYVGNGRVRKVYYGNTLMFEDTRPQVDPVLANNTWAVIKQVCESGQASNYWSVGDTKTDTGTDGVVRTFRIADMQGLYNKHVVFEQVNLYDTTKQWNPSSNLDDDNCYNDYAISTMVSTHLPAYELLLSSDLQATLTNTSVKVAKNGNNGTLLDVSAKLFLPASKEVNTSGQYARTEENNALTTWTYYTTHTTSSDRIKYDSTSTARAYWLRSPYSGFTYYVVGVYSNGSMDVYNAYNYYRVAPCFAY